jgi:hypothetical protein
LRPRKGIVRCRRGHRDRAGQARETQGGETNRSQQEARSCIESTNE